MPRNILGSLLPEIVNLGHPLNQGKVCWLLAPDERAASVPDLIGNNYVRLSSASGNNWKAGGPYRSGQIGPAWRPCSTAILQANGSDARTSDLRNNIHTGFSLALWVWPETTSASWLVTKGTVSVLSSGSGWSFHLNSGQRPGFYSGRASSFDGYQTDNTTAVPLKAWTRILWTYRTFGTDANAIRVFINGLEYSMTRNVPGNGTFVNDGLSQLHLGTNSNGGAPSAAWLSDVCIWNRGLRAQEAWAEYLESSTGYQSALYTPISLGQLSSVTTNKSVTSTLTLSQTITVSHVVSKSVTSTLVPVQTQSAVNVFNRSVTSTLVPVQTISLGFQDVEAFSNTINFTQTIGLNIVSNQAVISTLTLTQTAQASKTGQELVVSTLNLSQSILVNIVSNQAVISTLTLTQDIGDYRQIDEDLTSTLDLDQTVDFQKYNYEAVTSILTFTEAQTVQKLIQKDVHSTINLYHLVLVKKVIHLSVTSNLNLTQTQTGRASKSVSNTLTLTQTIHVDFVKTVHQSLEFTQSIQRQLTANRTVLQNPGLHQTLARNILARRSVSSTLNLTQSIVVHKVKFVNHSLNLTQTVDVISSKPVKSILTFAESITFNQIRNLAQSDVLILTQSIEVDKVLNRTVVPSVLAFDQYITVHKTHNLSVTSNLNLTQNIVRERFFLNVNSTLNLSQSVSAHRIHTVSVSSTLALSQSLSLNTSLRRTVVSNLIFLPYFTKPLNGIDIQIPILIVGKTQRFTLLKSRLRAITLPNPIFGDGESNTGIFTLRRGMQGKTYTYVKTTDFRKLAYTFWVPRIKAYELIDFVSESNSEVIDIENWKGEIWRTLISNNPTDFTSVERYASEKQFDDQREKVEVRLEFEGFRLV